jgi:hypothetical protein
MLSFTIYGKSFYTLILLIEKKYLIFISLFCISFKNSALALNRTESEPEVLLPDADLISLIA